MNIVRPLYHVVKQIVFMLSLFLTFALYLACLMALIVVIFFAIGYGAAAGVQAVW